MNFTLEAFYKYRDEWILYRSLGHETESGAWVSPLSYLEALTMPKEKIDVFQGLDYFLAQKKRHKAKMNKQNTPKKRGK